MTDLANVRSGMIGGPGQLTLRPAHSPNLYERSEPMSERTCSVDGCPKNVKARGWCDMHYSRWQRHGDPGEAHATRERQEGECSVGDCHSPAATRHLCEKHYARLRTTGTVEPIGTEVGAPRAFLERALNGTAPVEPNGCILWPYGQQQGYAYITHDGRRRQVGRLVLEHFTGPRPTTEHTMGHAPHDVCGNRSCIAPAHLSWQTMAEQVEQRFADGTHCPPPLHQGETHHRARYSDDVVADVRRRVASGESRRAIARELGVSPTTVRHWVAGVFRQAGGS